jgi:hypothetical protein
MRTKTFTAAQPLRTGQRDSPSGCDQAQAQQGPGVAQQEAERIYREDGLWVVQPAGPFHFQGNDGAFATLEEAAALLAAFEAAA